MWFAERLRRLVRTFAVATAFAGALSLAGCERKEKVLDIEAPGVDIEVHRSKDKLEIETNGKKDNVVDIEARGVELEVRRPDD